LIVPDNLGKTKVGNLDLADAACSDAGNELALIDLIFVAGLLGLRNLGRNNGNRAEQDVFRFDVARKYRISK